MPYGIIVQVPTDVIDAINDAAIQSPKLMQTAYKRATSRLKARWLVALRKEPPGASNYYKLPWKSDKQRRFVMAKLRKEGNLPYQRTHRLSQGWDVEFESFEDGGAVTVTNGAPESIFVYGDLDTPRQPMFEKIPWLEPNGVNNEFLDEAEEVLIQTWYTTVDPFAGVKG